MTAYTGTPALPAGLAGDIPNAATDWAAILAALHGLTDAWTAYTPAWTATTTNPVIGNGTISGGYARMGKLVHGWAGLQAGTTTTYGTGSYRLSLPVAAVAGIQMTATLFMLQNTVAFRVGMAATSAGSTSVLALYNSPNGDVTPTVPHTFGNLDRIMVSYTYEAA